jgi:hypothetical protein
MLAGILVYGKNILGLPLSYIAIEAALFTVLWTWCYIQYTVMPVSSNLKKKKVLSYF